jgi:hypothetical protein
MIKVVLCIAKITSNFMGNLMSRKFLLGTQPSLELYMV